MQTVEIKMRVPKATAQFYQKASAAERARIHMMIAHSLGALADEESFEAATRQLERTLDDVGAKATARGATEEIIREILDEK